MGNITLSFPYADALEKFAGLIVLASVLSLVCTALTEIIKNMFCDSLVKRSSSCIIAINGVVCIFTGIFWSKTFAREDISFLYSLWLGIILWLGSQGLFTTLEDSDGILGKFFRSLSTIANEENINDGNINDVTSDKENNEIQSLKDQIEKLTQELENKGNSDNVKEETIPDTDEVLFRYPVNYIAISEPYSTNHYAVDFGWNRNYGGSEPEIYSAFSGTVDMAGFYTGGAGNMVRIYFDDEANNCRWYAIYKHLSDVNVSKGDEITMGDKIGRMGNTGDATGNHLHFDLIKVPYGAGYTQTQASRAKYSVDPLLYLYVYPEQIVGDATDKKYNIMRLVKS
ncbi:MAG: M23 family metallopeptidase [Anaerofustis stercorihominis]|nr:M23 family metallopeptidase [Anaerofustis stercorihominis]